MDHVHNSFKEHYHVEKLRQRQNALGVVITRDDINYKLNKEAVQKMME